MKTVLGTLLALGVTTVMAGESEGAKSKLESVTIGDHWYGPNWSAEDLKGRVVLIDYWGQH